jgi:hypothetical protein
MDESGETPNTVTVHGPGEFTGDVAQLSGSHRSSVASPEVICSCATPPTANWRKRNQCAVQFYRGGAVDRMASAGDRERRQRVRPDGAGGVTVSLLDPQAAAVSSRNQPPRRVCRRRRAVRLGQARRIVRRRGGHGGPVRTRVLEGNVKRNWTRAHAARRRLNRPTSALSSPDTRLV